MAGGEAVFFFVGGAIAIIASWLLLGWQVYKEVRSDKIAYASSGARGGRSKLTLVSHNQGQTFRPAALGK